MQTSGRKGVLHSSAGLVDGPGGAQIPRPISPRGLPGAVDEARAAGILAALKRQPPFDMLGDATLAALVASMRMRELAAGEVVVEEGQLGSVCYVVDRGELAVVSGGVAVDTVSSGDIFGESAMLYDVQRVASLKASTEACVWALHRHVFQKTVKAETTRGRQEIHAFLRGAQLFSRLGDRCAAP